MSTLSADRIAKLLEPYFADPVDGRAVADTQQIVPRLGIYLDLLLRWNARTNLTAIREPEEIVRRHFGECLFAARVLSRKLATGATLLDFGSGAGFPGLPIQLYRPDLRVTLAESQGKKAAFLREAVRSLGLTTEIWANRVEDMPAARSFDCVTLRAVDRMEEALKAASLRVSRGGFMGVLAAEGSEKLQILANWETERFSIPESHQRQFILYRIPFE